jgi:hypothetical protein
MQSLTGSGAVRLLSGPRHGPDYAMRDADLAGFWAGTTERDRVRVRQGNLRIPLAASAEHLHPPGRMLPKGMSARAFAVTFSESPPVG